jgi:ABC-type sugar transport system permease subunit
MAVVLNTQFKGRIVFRVIFFVPIILNSGFIMSNMSDTILEGMNSLLAGNQDTSSATADLTNSIMRMINSQNSTFVNIIENYVAKINSIVNMSCIQILIYLAGLQTISPSVYEAASIEGANAWDNFWKITFPMMSPFLLVNAIYTIIDQLAGQGNRVVLFINSMIFGVGENSIGMASALSWMYLFIVIIILGVITFVLNKVVFYENN